MKTSKSKSKRWEKVKEIRFLPFEHISAPTLYNFMAGILAALAAQLFFTSPLSPASSVPVVVLVESAILLAFSSALMVMISFELDSYKEELPKGIDRETRRMNLEEKGEIHKVGETARKKIRRLSRLWIYLGSSMISAIYAIVIVWVV
jgi:hypothetical protein